MRTAIQCTGQATPESPTGEGIIAANSNLSKPKAIQTMLVQLLVVLAIVVVAAVAAWAKLRGSLSLYRGNKKPRQD